MSFSVTLLIFALRAAEVPPPQEHTDGAAAFMRKETGMTPRRLQEAVEAASRHPLGSKENPVRVYGPSGEMDYIRSLRCADGSSPKVGKRYNDDLGVFGTVVD